ncbi:phosphotriesterase [Oceanobacillus oncorhynchi]|uniref:phosphotriesterase n=1 Tax=Oceanobacillus oncorhynchi TaxID=545501 RepID=UPI0034D4E0E4
MFDVDYELKSAINEVKKVKNYHVKTICDPTVLGLGRDVNFIKQISEATGVNILVATGIYTYNDIPIHFRNQSVDYMKKQFIRDIETGIQNTDIKAAFIKCSSDKQGITSDIEKVIRAAARANLETGKPIMTHSYAANEGGLEQVSMLLEEGVKPSHILIGHTGDSDNLSYVKKLLDKGVYIGMDRYGLDKFLPTDKRNTILIKLLKEGYENQIFLSQDYCCNTDWYSEEHKKKESPNWSMSHIFEAVIPKLLENDISEEKIRQVMEINTKNWLRGVI